MTFPTFIDNPVDRQTFASHGIEFAIFEINFEDTWDLSEHRNNRGCSGLLDGLVLRARIASRFGWLT